MRFLFLLPLAMAIPAHAHTPLAPGIWTNVEDRYFAEEEGRETPPEMHFRIDEEGRWQPIDAYGEALADFQNIPLPGLEKRGERWEIHDSELRLARPFTCWVSVRKLAAKPDGSDDWSFQNNLKIFDQGGRVKVGGGDAPEATIRLRNVTWAKGSSNAPSLVIYAHREHAERATSYAWAAPGSERVGLNLRWLQGSCTRDDQAMGATSEALVAAGETWRQLYEAGDWKAIRKLYADDAVLMTADQDKIEGAGAIVSFLQRLSKAGATVNFRFDPEEAVASMPFGHVTARYRMDIAFPGREMVSVAGRSFLVYKWENGGWKLWRDMDNFAPDVTPQSFEDDTE